MNANQANNLDFPDLLSRMGFEPVSIKKQGNELWYCSPFRPEKEPSFHISRGRKYAWVWNDFGDMGGTVIDFVMRKQGHKSLKQVLTYLRTIYPSNAPVISMQQGRGGKQTPAENNLFSFHGQQEKAPDLSPVRELELIKAHQVVHPVIHSYLCKERAIPRPLVDKYVSEIRYRNKKTDKEFFAFGMKNQSDGYEIRAASDAYNFKSALISRDVSVMKGSQPQRNSVNIVEGMTDFLSLMAMYNTQQLAGDTIIMHSLSSYRRTADIISKRKYEHIHIFLDNNDAGRKYSQRFITDFGEKVTNQSSLFEPYEDLNDALRENRPSKLIE